LIQIGISDRRSCPSTGNLFFTNCFPFFKIHFYSAYYWALRTVMIWQQLLKRPKIYLHTSTTKKRTPPGGWI
ncbi:hypothetical protein T02_258, partial [Trichinella nativa]